MENIEEIIKKIERIVEEHISDLQDDCIRKHNGDKTRGLADCQGYDHGIIFEKAPLFVMAKLEKNLPELLEDDLNADFLEEDSDEAFYGALQIAGFDRDNYPANSEIIVGNLPAGGYIVFPHPWEKSLPVFVQVDDQVIIWDAQNEKPKDGNVLYRKMTEDEIEIIGKKYFADGEEEDA